MDTRHVVIFDGMCKFCSSGVKFVIRRDPASLFVFTPLQSKTAARLIRQYDIRNTPANTFVLIKNETCYFRSDAAIEIVKDLRGIWPLFRFCRIIPRSLRDLFYNLLANNRYRLFGQRKSCELPNQEVGQRFLD